MEYLQRRFRLEHLKGILSRSFVGRSLKNRYDPARFISLGRCVESGRISHKRAPDIATPLRPDRITFRLPHLL